MTSFKIEIDGLKEFKEALKSDTLLQRNTPFIGTSILGLHKILESRIETLFNAPSSLSSVLVGKSVKPDAVGKTFLRYSLQYRNVPIPLAKYPYTIENSSSISSAPIRGKNGYVFWKKGQYSKNVKVSVRKGKPSIARQPGGNFDKRRGFVQGKDIKARLTAKTWDRYPVRFDQGQRAPYSTLFGPSLADLANKVYEQAEKGRDRVVSSALDKVSETIADSFFR